MIQIEQAAGSANSRNVTFRVSAMVDQKKDGTPTADSIEVKTGHTFLKLTSLAWLIEEKMGVYFCWHRDQPYLPMESRNAMRFDQAIPSPKGWDGSIWLKPFKVTNEHMFAFTILDFDK